ncbi:MAG: ABC transporter ATP-binding protein [Candidatus Heimdallarchaeota archaeon]|nr:ABC transporter ATP-binding protein [Candidatus Heimdallarchaeota archaeon]
MFEISNLGIKYREASKWTLQNVSFVANPGEITLITGASGSGKSTLARALMTLIPKFSPAIIEGDILLDDQKVNSISRSEFIKLCGYVPQYPADFTTTLSVEEEIAQTLENLGYLSDQILRRMDEVFTLLEITHLRKKVQTELSSGELQRVALATAIAPDVPVLILDEPMARIDLKSELLLVKILVDLAKRGKTIIAFEHRLDYLLSVVHKVIFLADGEVHSQGYPKDIISNLINVDIPEVSLIEINSSNEYFLSITEAEQVLRQILQ